MTADLGRSPEAVGTGDGEGEPRLKGLLRHFAPPAAEIDMLDYCTESLIEAHRVQS